MTGLGRGGTAQSRAFDDLKRGTWRQRQKIRTGGDKRETEGNTKTEPSKTGNAFKQMGT